MKISFALLTALLLGSSSAGALAAATPEGAQRLTAALQAYLSAEAGVVTVTPSGETYALKIDAAPLLAKVQAPGFSASLTPVEMTLTELGGGKWQADQDQSISFTLKIEGAVDASGKLGSIKGTGVFDEAIGAFASSSTEFADFTFDQTVIDKGAPTKVSYAIAKIQYETTLAAAGDGADGTSKATMSGLKETVSTPGAPDGSMPPMEFVVTAATGGQDSTFKGLKPRAILDIMAWAVAHASPEAAKTDQAALKDKLRAAMPVFQNFSGVTTIDQMTVGTMAGQFGLDRLEMTVDGNGVVDEGRLREMFKVSGLTLPEGAIPPFATGLVPTSFTIDFNIADFNLAAPARIFIDNFDLSQDPPLKPELEQQLMQALLPKGAVTIGLGPSEFIAKVFNLKAEGSMTAGPVAMPAGQATIGLKGIDEVMTAIQSSPPEMGMQQMAPMIIVAKGMAKAEADGSLTWKIESTPQGGVLVNGVDVSKMGGQ